MEAESRRERGRCGLVSRTNPPIPPPHASPGANFSAVCPPLAPSHLLSPACEVILTISAPFDESPQRPCPRGPKGAHLKEETKLNNFLLYGFLIEDLGAELLAPKDWRKFSKYTQPPIILTSPNILDLRTYFGLSGRYNQSVQYGRECADKAACRQSISHLGST
jgi:hypothetical protein